MNLKRDVKIDVTVIVPALNEEGNILGVVTDILKSLELTKKNGEIIVVNDGSTDRTENIVSNLIKEHSCIRMVSHDTPKGIGVSYRDGFKVSNGEIVAWLPGDGENDAYEILRYLPFLQHVDIVIPYVHNINVRTWKRRILSKLYKGIINLSFGTLLTYMNGTAMFRKCVLQNIDLKSKGFFFQTELVIKGLKMGYLYSEVPYNIKQRESGEAKAISFKSLRSVAFAYLSTMVDIYILKKKDRCIAQDSITALRNNQWEKRK